MFMKCSSKIINNARFMQPLLPGFLYSFSIPMAFVKQLDKDLKGKSMKSMTSVVLTTEDGPGFHWFVKLEGGRCLKDGWKEFCEQHGLQEGDFLVFIHQLNLIFQVSVFDPVTNCQRCFIGSKTKSSTCVSKLKSIDGKRKSSEARVHDNLSVDDRQLSCRITLTPFAFKSKFVYLPKQFVRSSGLECKRCDIKLVNGEGKTSKVELNYKKYDGWAYIKGGWKEFQAANSLRPRDIICFRLLERGRRPIMKCYRLSSSSKS